MDSYAYGNKTTIGKYDLELVAVNDQKRDGKFGKTKEDFSHIEVRVFDHVGEPVGVYVYDLLFNAEFVQEGEAGYAADDFLNTEGAGEFDKFIQENENWIWEHSYNNVLTYDRKQIIDIPHQMPVRTWETASFEETAVNDHGLTINHYESIEQAAEHFDEGECPAELLKILESGEEAVEVSFGNTQRENKYFYAADFDAENFCENFLSEDNNSTIVLTNEGQALEELRNYRGHKELEVKRAIRSIIEAQRWKHY